MSEPDRCPKSNARMLKRVRNAHTQARGRNLFDMYSFMWRVLYRGHVVVVAILVAAWLVTLMGVAGSTALWLRGGQWTVLSVAGALVTTGALLAELYLLRRQRKSLTTPDLHHDHVLLKRIERVGGVVGSPSYRAVHVHTLFDGQPYTEVALVSDSVNKVLQSHEEIDTHLDRNALRRLHQRLRRGDAKTRSLEVLRAKFLGGGYATLFNERKLCLASEMPLRETLDKTPSVTIFRGDYLGTILTNYHVASLLEDRSNEPRRRRATAVDFPFAASGPNEPREQLVRVHESDMQNEFGVSVLALTQDNTFLLLRQASWANSSQGLLAPSGSGGLDWLDYVETCRRGLLTAARHGMKRELLEEAFQHSAQADNLDPDDIRVEVIGYFRWARLGGKPELLGLAKVPFPLLRVRANDSEVRYVASDAEPHDIRRRYLEEVAPMLKATNIDEARDVLSRLLREAQPEGSGFWSEYALSVPLAMNVQAALEAFDNDPERWNSFLFGERA